MFQRIATALAKEMLEIASNTDEGNSDFFHMHEKGMYSLSGENHRKLIKFSQSLSIKSKSENKISERHALKIARSILAKIVASNTFDGKATVDDIAGAMEEMHNYSLEQTVYLRVKGLRIIEPMTIGNVDFIMCSKEKAEELITEIYEKVDFPAERQSRHFNERFASHFNQHCIAVNKIIAEPIKAFERAHDETRRSLEILRYAATNMNFGENVKFGLDGDPSFADNFAFISSTEVASGDVNPDGKVVPFRLDKLGINQLHELGAFKLGDFLRDSNLSPFKETLLRAVHWLSSAVTQAEKENKYLHLIIALEALFTPPKGDPISNTIAESTALTINNTLSGRLQIKTLIKKCYGKRSAIAHGGKSAVKDDDLNQLIIIVWNTIKSLIDKADDFKDQDALRLHFENMKFSGMPFKQ